MNKLFSSTVIAAIFWVVFLSPFSSAAAKSNQVQASAFQAAEFGEVFVWYYGAKKPQLFSYDSNEEAADALTLFLRDEAVWMAQPNYQYTASVLPNDPDIEQQQHLELINAFSGWERQSTAKDVVIAIVDSGVDLTHPDLADNIWNNTGERLNGIDDDRNGFIDDIAGWDFLENTPDPSPHRDGTIPENAIGVQHGTMVAGIIAGRGNNNKGISGVVWDTNLMVLRVLNNIGIGTSETVTEALMYAIDNGADVINLSLVGTDYDPIVVELLKQAYEEGIIIVAAAGNNGANLNSLNSYPVCYNHMGPATIIGVGAVTDEYARPDFSNYGADCVDVVAPGVKIYSTRHSEEGFIDTSDYAALYSGTSFAAPQVTGAVALLKQQYPLLTSQRALHYLQAGSKSLAGAYASTDGFDYSLNIAGSLSLLANDLPNLPTERGQVTKSESEFIVYPLSDFDSLAFRYKLPGPLLQTPIVFEDEQMKSGIRMTSYSPFSGLVNAWHPESKVLYSYELFTGETSRFLTIPDTDPQTIGSVAVGNVDFENEDDIVIASGPNTKPMVSVYTHDGHLLFEFSPYEDEIDQGLSVALWDINDDKVNEIVVVPANQTDGQIRVFDYTGVLLAEFFSYENFGGGATLSVADLNEDGIDELFVGPGKTGGPHIKIFNTNMELVDEFFAGDVLDAGGAHLDVYDFDRDGERDFVLTFKETGTPVIRLYTLNGEFRAEHGVLDGGYSGGIGIFLLD